MKKDFRKLGKRGQVTMFIIVGIVILIVAVFLGYITSESFREKIENVVYKSEIVPEQIMPVERYVENCVNEITRDAVEKMEWQGGYIEIPKKVAIRNEVFDNSLRVFPGEDYRVAYWLYEDSSNRVNDGRLSFREMEENLEDYIETNLDDCVGDFEEFEEMEIIKPGNIKSDVAINDNGVEAKVSYSLKIKYKNDDYRIRSFLTSYRTDFKRLYGIASEIMDKENEESYLEDLSLDIIYLYKDDIPYSDFVLDCAPKIWRKSEIIERLKNIISVNIPLVNVKKTNFIPYDERFVWDVTDKEHNDVKVNVEYSSDWPMYVKIFPHNGEIIQAMPVSKNIKLIDICTNYMHFFYDITYPVMFSVSNLEGESFRFASHVIIKSNNAREPATSFDVDEESVGYCDFANNEFEITVIDANTQENVENARISFNCVNQGCYIGEGDENGILRAYFPACYNGGLIVNKEGYKEYVEKMTTFGEGSGESRGIALEPFVDKRVKIMVYDDLNNEARELRDDEQAFIELNNYDSDGRLAYSTYVISGETSRINLTSEKYFVEGDLYKKGEIKINEKEIKQCRCPKVLGMCLCGSVETKIPGITLEMANVGGMKAEWNIRREELENSEEIVFYLYNQGTPSSYDELKEREKKEIMPELK